MTAPTEEDSLVRAAAFAFLAEQARTRLAMQRVHQTTLRQRVLRDYRDRCAVCRLRHEEFLDAAHILPDSGPRGVPSVENGLALVKSHYAASERHFAGIRPDVVVTVRADLLDEEDGPMLLHGLKGLHGQRIVVPDAAALRPDPEFPAARFELFTKAG